MKTQGMSNAFHQIGFNGGVGGYGVDPMESAIKGGQEQLAIMSEGQQDLNERSTQHQNSKGFFMTAADEFEGNSPSPRRTPGQIGLKNQLSSPRK